MVDTQTLAHFGSFVGGIAVVASLIYLAIQIRQNTKLLKISALNSATEVYVAFNQMLGSDAIAARVFQTGIEDFARLDEGERHQFLNLLRACFINHEHVYKSFEAGVIENEVWESNRAMAKRLLRMPHVSAWWEVRRVAFTPSFVRAIDVSPEVDAEVLPSRVIQAMLEARQR